MAASRESDRQLREQPDESHTLYEVALDRHSDLSGGSAGGVGSLSVRQLNWGLDFTGGTLVEVAYSDSADLSAIRAVLDQEGYEGAVVVSFGTDKDVLVRSARWLFR